MPTITIEDNYDLVKEHYLIILDSRNATTYNNGNALTNLTFAFPNPVISKRDDIIALTGSVSNFTCPNSQYVINQNNAYFLIGYFDNLGYAAEYTIQMPNGYYNPTSFVTAFNALLNYTIPSNKLTLSIYNTQICRFNLVSTGNDFYLKSITKEIFTNYKELYRFGEVLGYDDKVSYYSGYGTTINNIYYSGVPKQLLMPFIYNLSGINSINIHLDNIQTRNIDSLTKTNSTIVCNIPVSCNPNEMILFDKRSDFEFKINEDNLNSLKIRLTDGVGNLLDLNNQNWNMSFEIIVVKKQRSQIKSFSEIISGGISI